MKKLTLGFPFYLIIILIVIINSCSGQNENNQISAANNRVGSHFNFMSNYSSFYPTKNCLPNPSHQIAENIHAIYQDKWGNFWYGTQSKGLALNMSNYIMYFTEKDGLNSHQINGISADSNALLWLATSNGVSTYNGAEFHNYTTKNGLLDNQVHAILVDSKGGIWAATSKGVCIFNGTTFEPFKIPKPSIENPTFIENLENVWQILEDHHGNIWFARDGYGIAKYNGEEFTLFTKKDGLRGNDVASIAEDKNGNLWIGSIATRVPSKENEFHYVDSKDGGLTKFDGKKFIQFPEVDGLTNNDVYPIYTDKKGNVWIGSKHLGLYKYKEDQFKLYKNGNNTNTNVLSVLEDFHGKIWMSLTGGLFKLNNEVIENVPLSYYQYNDDPYRLKLRIENEEESKNGIVYSLKIEMKMDPGAFFISPNSPGTYSGIFDISLNNTSNLALDAKINETPKSLETTNSYSGDPVNYVTENTVYRIPITVKTENDFEVEGTIQFVIEPKCTMEEVPFVITFSNGNLKIKRTDNKGC